MFAHGLLRGGYTQWFEERAYRLSEPPPSYFGGHLGLGAGLWGRVAGRVLVGGDVVVDVVLSDGGGHETPRLMFSLTLGGWL